MVTFAALAGGWGSLLAEKPLLDQLDPESRARVIATLAWLILLGFFLVALVWLGGRVTRRYMRRGKPTRVTPTSNSRDDWARPSTEGEGPAGSEPREEP